MVRVRIAPSPTGIPHIGNTRTALFNYLFAKHNDGKFVLRIEDTDRARLVAESEGAIYEILEWLGLLWDEKYKQSERVSIYKEYADKLVKEELAYRDEGAIRFRIEKSGETSWMDAIGNKQISFDNNKQEDFVLLKSDGFPTYNFANVVDDHLMKISHVIRGDEFISSTPKHIMLYRAFDWEQPVFAHLPVILGSDRQKLSKREGAQSVLYYRDQGYLKEALLNFMALLGWSPGEDREIMTMEEMIQLFDLKDVNTASSIFDIKKLEWMNGVYIRESNIDDLKSKILLQNPKLKMIDDRLLDKLVPLAQSRMKTLNDFEELVKPILEEPKTKFNKEEKEIAGSLKQELSAIEPFSYPAILDALKSIIARYKVKMNVLYKIFTGQESGLPLPEMLEILGKEKTISRLEKGVAA